MIFLLIFYFTKEFKIKDIYLRIDTYSLMKNEFKLE